jgi:hypothetical protein
MGSPTIIRLKDENSFDHAYRLLSFRLPESERITMYVARPHIIACSIDPHDLGINVARWGKYVSQPVHFSDFCGMPTDIGATARDLVNEPSLEERFPNEVKTVISLTDGEKKYFGRVFEAVGDRPGTIQVVSPYLVATSMNKNAVIDTGVNICGFNFLSRSYGTDKFSISAQERELNDLPEDIRAIARELIEATKRNN